MTMRASDIKCGGFPWTSALTVGVPGVQEVR